jgi:hypothetical protein
VTCPRAAGQIFTFCEGPDQIWSYPLNDKRIEMMKLISRLLEKKLADLKKKGRLKIYRFQE